MVRLHKRIKGKDEVPSAQQASNIEKYQKYLAEQKIPELFNRLLTQIIHDKPKNVRQHIIEQLTAINHYKKNPGAQQPSYFTSEDFETMFDSYEIGGEGNVDYPCLLQALTIAGVNNPEKALSEDFPQIKSTSYIAKPQFANIMMTEFSKRGFSN